MSRKSLVIIIIVILIILGLAVYFAVSNLSGKSNQKNQNSNPSSFDVQGMKVEILRQGSGAQAKAGDYVTTNYVGTLEDGTQFDSSIQRNTPFTFQLGQNRVIKGWDLGVAGMKVGEERKLTIPFELAYGADGFPPKIPPKSTLIFVIDLLSIKSPSGK